MSLTFEQPLWLLLTLAIVPLAWAGMRWFNTMSRARAWSAIIARAVLLTLLAGALAGAATVRTSERLAVVAVFDVSDSVKQFAELGATPDGRRIAPTEAMLDWLNRAGARRGPEDLLGAVVFDGRSIALATPTPGKPGLTTLDYAMAEGTDIARALKFAAAIIPADAAGRIVLASDGNETSGDALAAARETSAARAFSAAGAGRSALPIDVLPITYRVRNEVMVEAIDAPPRATSQSSVTVRVVLNATDAASGTLELLYEGKPLDINGEQTAGSGRRLQLAPGRSVHLIDVKLGPGVVHRLEAVFVADAEREDRLASNNRAQTFVVSPGKGSVLIVDGVSNADAAGPGATLGRTLKDAKIDTVTVAPGDVPSDLLSMQAYDLIVLQNVPADALSRDTHTLLADYVRDMGGGLVMVGGPDSFGAGGWKGTAIEPILPVRLDLPEQLITPSAAVVIVLDSSGSMRRSIMGGSRSQQEIANDGAALAIETLDKTDLVGVIEFNSDYRVVVPLAKNDNAKQTAARVRAISSQGGTNIYPAMARARAELLNVKASVKHVIVLTDGRSEGEPDVGINLAQEMSEAGITVSTIAVGDDADRVTLSQIARTGRGQFYHVIDQKLLPRVFVKEIRVVRKPLIRESPFVPINVRAGSPLLKGVPDTYPSLRGLVLTQPKQDQKVTYALITGEGEPVLAQWYAGRGQVAAFTSDAHDAWARDWLNWPGYAAMWTQIARTIARPPGGRNYELNTEIVGDELRVRLDAADDDGAPIGEMSVPGFVTLPGGGRAEVSLAQTGPGTYEGRVPALERGNYVVALAPSVGTKPMPPVWGGATRAIGPEFARLSSNAAVMQQLADSTGGRLLRWNDPESANLWDRENLQPTRASLPLWPALVAWAIGVFLIDVGTRRVAWDRLVSRAVLAQIREEASAAVKTRADRAAATARMLRTVGERVDRRTGAVSSSNGPAAPNLPSRDAVRAEPERSLADELESPAERAEREAREQQEQEERRKRLRQQMLKRVAGGTLASDETTATPGATKKPANDGAAPGGDAPKTGDLLAAKRRVRERFSGGEPPPGGSVPTN